MKRTWLAAAALLLAGAAAAQPVQVMVLGTYHFGNPGQDIHNAKVDDVLTPQRQAEVQAVVEALARFAPQRVAVERLAEKDGSLPSYDEYLQGRRDRVRNEVEQIGFRLARRLGLGPAAVNGIDIEGEFPFAPVQAFAQREGRGAELQASIDAIGTRTKAFEAAQRSSTIGQLLRRQNEPAAIGADHGWYMQALQWGRGDEQPGARLVAAWHARNLGTCARLVQRVKPGERVLVVYGSGHAHLLRRCVAEMPGWQLVEPNDFLPP